MSNLLGVVRRPGVARLGGGGLVSEIGDWMMFIALPLFVLQLTGSPLVTATVFALQLVPSVLVGPLAGVLVDRLDPWSLMAGVAAGQAVALLGLLAVDTDAQLWLLYLIVGVQAVLSTVIEPCRAVTAAALVPVEDLATVNQVMGVLSNSARLIGGPLGGLALGLTGIEGVLVAVVALYLLTAATFVIGTRSLRRPGGLHVDDHATASPAEGSSVSRLGKDWREGMRVVATTAVLRRVMAVAACTGIAQGAFIVLFVLFVVRDLHGSETDVGILRGVQAIGAVAGGLLLGVLIRRWSPARLASVALAAFGALSLVVWNAPALTTELGVYIALFIAAGVPGMAAMTGLLTLLQTHTDPGSRGRVLSTFFAVFSGVQAAGMLLAGLVGTGAGLTVALQVQACLYLLAAALSLRITTTPPATPAGQRAGRPVLADRVSSSQRQGALRGAGPLCEDAAASTRRARRKRGRT
ncbi:MFS transporter [Pseudonocardia xinjiangensis]|uniref:MFS transporter n=1 Tax=Pseudonocardia xinjiangensis TaxID=75289 RepID=A0ABX1RK69_9PSEU|nr:MFS transporter [Pseudonocardia xinjiangensis]NMH80392.1 MFS transporter [Pseudonocardia xinjiangensis]